ncbi:heparan sulfate 2-O-sulfotransferase pipe [Diaphorina citri]|uniref:Heparan sulfate 2-O-sulfotransferase pipe n=1 Tax=Diaphorina citri TaxID=121845 RepID=A0A1S3DJM3_DIACI|nr:heparan sulfate 2-O-sulfotransferase pipe [Diaphorina citri]
MISINDIQEEPLDPLSLNNTARARHEVLFFNRVPKVGSQTFMELMRHLSVRNGFGFHRDHIQRVETIRLPRHEQSILILPPLSPIRFHLPEPIYVNLVRDPVERVISWYYYVRAPWYYVERKQAFPDLPLPDPAWLKKDFETCVLRGDRECTYLSGETREGIGDHRRQSLFFLTDTSISEEKNFCHDE